eukprot:999434-Pyramimonas_sp.AAC.1
MPCRLYCAAQRSGSKKAAMRDILVLGLLPRVFWVCPPPPWSHRAFRIFFSGLAQILCVALRCEAGLEAGLSAGSSGMQHC